MSLVEMTAVMMIPWAPEGRPRIPLAMQVPLMSPLGSWGWQIARVHLPVGHEAARGNAASPSMPVSCITPAVFFAADMGVGVPMRGFQGGTIVARLVPSILDSLWLSWWLVALLLRWRRRMSFFTDFVDIAVLVGVVGKVTVRTA
jgi:hypothetical protein